MGFMRWMQLSLPLTVWDAEAWGGESLPSWWCDWLSWLYLSREKLKQQTPWRMGWIWKIGASTVSWLFPLKRENSQFLCQVINRAYLGSEHFLKISILCNFVPAGEPGQQLSKDLAQGHLVDTRGMAQRAFFPFHLLIRLLNPVQLRKPCMDMFRFIQQIFCKLISFLEYLNEWFRATWTLLALLKY